MRTPFVAGQFYPGDKNALLGELEKLMPSVKEKKAVIGVVSPHAGYMFSGAVAGMVFAGIAPADTYVIIGPSHTARGARFASSRDQWRTPLGTVDPDEELLDLIMGNTRILKDDDAAHAFEHSIEVQLPFIQKISPGSGIVPICMQSGDITEYKELADAIASAVKKRGKKVVVVASSDMTHYESRVAAAIKDKMAIDKILKIDAEGLVKVVESNDISMCGYIPAAVMLMCAKNMAAQKATLVRYCDSGDVTGDISEVVGDAGIMVY